MINLWTHWFFCQTPVVGLVVMLLVLYLLCVVICGLIFITFAWSFYYCFSVLSGFGRKTEFRKVIRAGKYSRERFPSTRLRLVSSFFRTDHNSRNRIWIEIWYIFCIGALFVRALCRDCYEAAIGVATTQDRRRTGRICRICTFARQAIYWFLYVKDHPFQIFNLYFHFYCSISCLFTYRFIMKLSNTLRELCSYFSCLIGGSYIFGCMTWKSKL